MSDDVAYDQAAAAAGEVIAQAAADGKAAVCVAVVDRHGDLVYFARMPGAPVRGIRVAINKAYTAARWGRDTEKLKKRLLERQDDLRWFGDARFTALPGGLVLARQGTVIGALGISGRTSEEDCELGRAALQKLG